MTRSDKGPSGLGVRRSVIQATGSCVPEKVLTNDDLEKMVDTSDEWITTRTGIKERRIISNGQTTASLATTAAKRALETAQISPDQLDAIICATITPEMVFPSTACFVQHGLGAYGCCAFDLSAACSGFTYGIATADSLIRAGQAETVFGHGRRNSLNHHQLPGSHDSGPLWRRGRRRAPQSPRPIPTAASSSAACTLTAAIGKHSIVKPMAVDSRPENPSKTAIWSIWKSEEEKPISSPSAALSN